jgi:hypothetical protein
MTKNEFMHMAALLGEAEAALDLIVNQRKHSGLGDGGDKVFRETISDIKHFKNRMFEKYKETLFEWHEPQ